MNMKGLFWGIIFLSSQLFAEWIHDCSEAKRKAKEENKPLLIAFLGPDWSIWSDALEEDILSQENFLHQFKDKCILLKIDLPEDLEKKNFIGKEMKEQFGIDQCPSIVLAKPSGKVIAILPSLPMKIGDFCTSIEEILSDYEKIEHVTQKELSQMGLEELKFFYTKAGRLADETFKKGILAQGLKRDEGSFFLLEEYKKALLNENIESQRMQALRKKIVDRDPTNEKGTLRSLAWIDFETRAAEEKEANLESVVFPLVEYLKSFGKKDPENAWQIEMKISQYFFTHNQIAQALYHAKASLETAPEESRKEIAQSIEYLKSYNP